MQEYEKYLEDDFIIYNCELGIRDFVNIGEIDSKNKTAYLDDPYEMVGPFCLEELCSCGVISFAACMVMSEQYWHTNRIALQEESMIKQKRLQEELYRKIHMNNQRKRDGHRTSQKEHRKLLCLPLEGKLETTQIKFAFKQVARKEHPDVGGSHERFIKITEARDTLLEYVELSN